VKAWKAILAVIVIFIAGAVTGGLQSKPPQWRPMGGTDPRLEYLKRMKTKLDLTPAQDVKIGVLLNESEERLKKIWEPVAPQFKKEVDSVRDAMLAELTPEQQERYKKLAEIDRARRKLDRGFNNPRHPHGQGTNSQHAPNAPAPAPTKP